MQVSIYLRDDMLKRLDTAARAAGKTRPLFISDVLDAALAARKKPRSAARGARRAPASR